MRSEEVKQNIKLRTSWILWLIGRLCFEELLTCIFHFLFRNSHFPHKTRKQFYRNVETHRHCFPLYSVHPDHDVVDKLLSMFQLDASAHFQLISSENILSYIHIFPAGRCHRPRYTYISHQLFIYGNSFSICAGIRNNNSLLIFCNSELRKKSE